MDTSALADEIIDICGFNIGLGWKVMSTGTRQINKDNIVCALAVECSAKVKWRCQHKLLQLYSRATKPVQSYPNRIRACKCAILKFKILVGSWKLGLCRSQLPTSSLPTFTFHRVGDSPCLLEQNESCE